MNGMLIDTITIVAIVAIVVREQNLSKKNVYITH